MRLVRPGRERAEGERAVCSVCVQQCWGDVATTPFVLHLVSVYSIIHSGVESDRPGRWSE
jgi:hypothetical protein